MVKKLLSITTFIAFLLFIGCSTTNHLKKQNKDTSVSIKVMSYNIYSARKLGLQSIADVINKVNPDLVSLQEVERNTDVNPSDVPKDLAKMTNMPYYIFIHALDLKKGDYGNVILSKYPIMDQKTYKLGNAHPKDYVRSFGYIKIQKDEKTFYFAATHLDHKYDDASRLKQVGEIIAYLKEIHEPIILAGDLNTRIGSKTIDSLKTFFTTTCGNDTCAWTVPTPKPTYTCDWILYTPANRFDVLDYKVCEWANKQSDHFPVEATLRLR